MKIRIGACALLACLAGCSAADKSAGFGGLVGAASSNPQAGNQVAPVRPGPDAEGSIANAPDRGVLISYQNNGVPPKQEGAFTWYPVAISEQHALRAVATGVMTIPAPDGSQVKLRYERHVEHPDGNWTWIGRVEGGDPNQEAILTFGEKAVFGSIPQAAGAPTLSLETRNGVLWAVVTDPTQVVSPNKGKNDVLVPPPLALRGSLVSAAMIAQITPSAAVAGAAATSANTIDVAIGYTEGFATGLGGQSAAVTRLNFLIEVGNQAFTNSSINGNLRIVQTVQLSYADNTANEAALGEMTGFNGRSAVSIPASLLPIRTARDQYGADLVVLVRKFQTPENDGCGIAWLNGAGQTPISPAADDDFGYSVVSDGNDTGTDGRSYFCVPETLVHELGHLMGSAHDRENSTSTSGALLFGRYPYSFGMKTDIAGGNFYTIMAYGENNQNFYRTFSNPLVARCGPSGNLSCGVTDQTDNARSLNQTIPLVATFRSTVVPFAGAAPADMNGDGKSDLVWWNSNLGVLAYWVMNGPTYVSGVNFGVGTSYQPASVGKSTTSGRSDILMRRAADRALFSYRSTGTGFSPATIGQYGDGWVVAGQGDVDGDGKDDILWRHPQLGYFAYWLMDGAVYRGGQTYTPPASFEIAAIADFNGDGRVDIVFNNPAVRSASMWLSTGGGFTVSQIGQYGADWRLIGAADATGDGKADILLRNTAKTFLAYWRMDGAVYQSSYAVPTPTTYELATTADYNGDGIGDLVWINSTNRFLVMWLGNGTNFGNYVIGQSGADWALQK